MFLSISRVCCCKFPNKNYFYHSCKRWITKHYNQILSYLLYKQMFCNSYRCSSSVLCALCCLAIYPKGNVKRTKSCKAEWESEKTSQRKSDWYKKSIHWDLHVCIIIKKCNKMKWILKVIAMLATLLLRKKNRLNHCRWKEKTISTL